MSKSIKLLSLFAVVGTVAACGQQAADEEFVVVEPAPITQEPVYTGKYK